MVGWTRYRLVMAGFFGLTGMGNGLWGACLPAVDARLDLGPGRLGVVLLVLGVGTLVTMPVTGALADRVGGRRVLRVASVLFAASLAGPAVAGSYPALVAGMLLLSLVLGVLNVALTVQAVDLERSEQRPTMATLHGVWALGALTGGGATAAALRAGADSRLIMLCGAAVAATALLVVGRLLPPPAPVAPTTASTGPAGPLPTFGLVVLLGLIGAAAFLTENAATDWAGVHARRVLGADTATASLAYTVFFAAMTGVRLLGDAVRARLGAARVVLLAGTTASVGYGVILLTPALGAGRVAVALGGWVLAGAGMALMWPIVSSTVGAAFPGRAKSLSLVTTLSYGGGLLGPAVMGYAASATSLSSAMVIPAALVVLVTVTAPRVLRLLTAAAPAAATPAAATPAAAPAPVRQG
ncbi:MFS transporter [Micromonospora mangrovi]|uniref:MFS transporter n=2 Tax=Micromonospora TaxID=1873 RepID=A0AAU7M7K1_9ACTN